MNRKKNFLTFFTSLSISTLSRGADINKDLFLYLPMDEGSGNVKDYSPNNFRTKMSKNVPKQVGAKKDTFGKALQFDDYYNFVKVDAAIQGYDFDAHFDKSKGMTILRETGTDKHGQMRQLIVMKGGLKEWEFALYVYDSLQPGISAWGYKTGGGDTWGGNLGNEWHYQCGTYSIKDGMKLYLDGTEKVVAQGDNVGDPCAEGNRPIFIAHREDGQ